MKSKTIHGTNFRKVLELFNEGRDKEAADLLKIIQEEFLELYTENNLLKKQVNEVAEVLDLAECMDFDGQKYWIDDDSVKNGPYCQVCYDTEGILVRLQERDKYWECFACKNIFVKLSADNDQKVAANLKKKKEPLKLFVTK
ncbi:hypothetical protein [Maridesulfovibrio bastinii]|jgi:hypothetical protein|uniref:hypothetical protein n=1 Tax=Maridesulfovibrio bastinii TaxID=47157 RepID=UPI0003FD362D|nr:hypothetical protein [Maridesulfovibrio bastinii]